METQIRALRNAKVGTNKHDSFAPTYRELKKEFCSTNNVEHEFWLCPDDIKVQALCEWQQEEICARVAYNAQYMGHEDRYQSLEVGGVGT